MPDGASSEGTLRLGSSDMAESKQVLGASSDFEAAEFPLQLLQRFLQIQEERARIYTDFERGFKRYLLSASEVYYRQVCDKLTTDFSNCSRQVLAIEAALRSAGPVAEEAAELVHRVQSQERTKLELTATLQVLRKVGPPADHLELHGADLQGEIHSCHSTTGGSHSDSGEHGEEGALGVAAAEAKAEFSDARRDATQKLQKCIETINETLEEVRYEVEEWRERETLR
eukprot:TRINITY_DN22550_c0_g1_i1.p1 TRINITY_DN22550_c0_g1~~TRINITY_DN22550_c0_g1_i1.p1  ORF type:complete len:228 (+),score=27.72 TRINITY_DN22550_c0_g1_i1:59-742(+)